MDEQTKENKHKSIFDEKFKYAKIPIEVLLLKDINAGDKMILSRVIYWTRRGMPCTHSNRQFGELIGRSETQGKGSVYKLIRKGYVHRSTWNDKSKGRRDSNRELTACIGVDAEMQLKRMQVQAERKARAKARQPEGVAENRHTPRQKTARGGGGKPTGTTKEQLINNYSVPQPSPVKRASAPSKHKRVKTELTEKEFEERRQRMDKALTRREQFANQESKYGTTIE